MTVKIIRSTEPLPCPFCGWGTIVDEGIIRHSCVCMSCGARTRKAKTWELAVKLWNTREVSK